MGDGGIVSLSAERWRIVKSAFAELADVPEAERDRRLAEMTFNDAALRAEVESLLRAADEVGDRFERAPVDGLLTEEEVAGQRVGPYQVIREIGRGGMGTVYEALRADDAFQKRVALKMVARGRDTDQIVRRFRHERQILARLEHKNIAALLDGGVTTSGQPYFAMEYVEGIRVDRYCAQHQLGVNDRLKLFRQICAAVHYAHQNLVVHRDLKPSNILVTASGTVKLLDFGIAKLVGPDYDDGARLTETGVAPMTTAYASPEQIQGLPVTTASDIYSLGVLLYELLAGRPPFESTDLPVLELRRRMLDSAPLPPSRAVSQDPASAAGGPATRRLRRTLRGELDNIVLMALRKEPERRYPTVEALSEDLLRYLAGLPIDATPDSLGYRVSKFVRRNGLAVAAGGVALAAVIGGAGASLWQARAATAERDRAEFERAKAEQVTDFFRSIILAAKPANEGPSVTVVAAIDGAIARLDSSFAGNPRLLANIKSAVGSTLYDMGQLERSAPLIREAFQLQMALDSGRVTWEAATVTWNLAGLEETLGRLPVAESLYRRSMAMYEGLPQTTPVEVARGWGQVATMLATSGRHEEALALQKRVVDLLRVRTSKGDRSLAIAIGNYASNLTELGRLTDAEPLHREAVALQEASRGPDDPGVAGLLQPLGINLLQQGRLDEAEAVARRAHRISAAALGSENPATLAALRGLLNVLVERGSCDDVIRWTRWVIERRGTTVAETDLSLGSAYLQLGQCLERRGELREAETALREGLSLRLATLPADHWAVGNVRSVLGTVLGRSGRADEAERELLEGYRLQTDKLGPGHLRSRDARERLASFYRATGRADRIDALPPAPPPEAAPIPR